MITVDFEDAIWKKRRMAEDDDVFSAGMLYLMELIPGSKIWEFAARKNRPWNVMSQLLDQVAEHYPNIPQDTFELLKDALCYPRRISIKDFYERFKALDIYN